MPKTVDPNFIAQTWDAFNKEGVEDANGNTVLPEDFFDRMCEKFSTPQPGVLDQLVNDLCAERDAKA